MLKRTNLICTALLAFAMAGTGGVATARQFAVAAGSGALQRIIDNSGPGDIVRLESGIHLGPVVIDHPMTLLATRGRPLSARVKARL